VRRGGVAAPRRSIVPVLLLLASCRTAEPLPASFDWTVGTWTGARRAGEEAVAAPMTLRVEALPGAAGQVECLRVEAPSGPYLGFAIRRFDPASGRWGMLYANSPGRTFARLEGELAGAPGAEVDGSSSLWTSTTTAPPRGSRLVSERIGADRWRRTQLVSEDGGATWRVLFIDELVRDAAP
jgi:hypothetical protein